MANNEIDLIGIIRKLWQSRIFIVKVAAVFFALGIIIAITSKTEYTASCKLLPENQNEYQNSLQGLGGLAGLAGINLNTVNEGVLTPELYPEIVRSFPFQQKLIHEPITFEVIDTTISSYNYFKAFDSPSLIGVMLDYTIGLPGKIRNLFGTKKDSIGSRSEGDFQRVTVEELNIIKSFMKRTSVIVSSQTNIITVTGEMPDPVAAAKITDLLVKQLTTEVTNYKINKLKVNLAFVEERFEEAKSNYRKRQVELARFTDRNRNISSSISQTEYQRLQNELTIAFEVYKSLASQLEQTRIKVKEKTPIFTILEPVQVPLHKSKPQKKLIAAGFIFLGLFAGIGLVILKSFLKSLKT